MTTRAAIYTRLSKNRAGEKSATIEYQKEHGAEIADGEGWSVVNVFEDNDLTGTKHANRAGYQQLKRLVEKKGIDVIVVQDTDRLWRDDRESGPFRDLCAQNDIDIRTWSRMELRTDDPFAYQALALQDVNSAAYAKLIGKKVKDFHQRRLKEGRVNGGGRMFGERSPEQAEVVRALAGRVLAGESLNSMSRWLNDHDYETTRGNPWQATTLKKLLTNPRLAGWLYSKGEKVGRIADYESILDDETFEKVRVVLTSPIFQPNRGKPSRLLTPFLRCSTCGGSMKGSSNGQRKTYTCRSDRPCSRRMTVTADLADNAVVERVLVRMEAIRGLAELIEAEASVQASGILAQLATIEERKRRAYAGFIDGAATKEMYDENMAKLEVEETELRDQLVPMVLDPGDEQPRQVWEKSSYQQRKAILALNVESIRVMPPTTQSRKGFNPNRLVIRWKTSQVEDRIRKGRHVFTFDVGDISEAEAERIMQAGLGFLAERGFDAKGKLGDSDGARGMTEELKQALAGYIATILEGSKSG